MRLTLDLITARDRGERDWQVRVGSQKRFD